MTVLPEYDIIDRWIVSETGLLATYWQIFTRETCLKALIVEKEEDKNEDNKNEKDKCWRNLIVISSLFNVAYMKDDCTM